MLTVFSQAFGVDSSCTMVALSTIYLRHEICCRVMLCDGKSIPYPDGIFDFVYSFTCFQHIEDLKTIAKYFYEAYRVLHPSGRFRLQTVLGKRDVGLHDGYVFETPAELSNHLLAAGFRMTAHTIDEEKSWIWITATK
jgi:ubiquinone/menaquinone biosynthesis C-methylase UbiE